jgi:FkbM family methyltransferase
MYSQNNEEEVILRYFSNKNEGFFLDIGAYHPFKFSNTRRLYELGWYGIYIEPSPICFKSFTDEYSGSERVCLINKAVVPNDKNESFITFFESNGDAVSTSDVSHKSKWEKSGTVFKQISVPAIKVNEVEMIRTKKIDLLSLDVESCNYNLFTSFSDVFLFNLECICIEHDGFNIEILNRLERLGFTLLLINAENIILGKDGNNRPI